MTIDELKRALECHAKDDCCSVCPFNYSENCSEDMALAALDALDTKAEPLDQRQTVLMAIERLIHATENVREFEWISMDEAKPNKDGLYLTWHGKSATLDWLRPEGTDFYVGVTGWYAEKGGWYSAELNMPIKTVTHWMELPAAPEGWG